MTIAVIGKTGQLARALKDAGNESQSRVHCFDRKALDLSDPNCAAFIEALPNDITGVILAAAYTDVDGAQSQADLAHRVNAAAAGEIAAACAARNLPLIYISTDYVFDGEKDGAYSESDAPNPINLYGQSKWDGERAVRAAGGQACIIRTSWVYDARSRNFLTTMLAKGHDDARLNIVGDQWGLPTYAPDLARAALALMQTMMQATMPAMIKGRKIAPLYHIAGSGEPVSWAGFAKFIFQQAGQAPQINVVSSAAYKTAARRPKNSVLDTARFARDFAPLPLWTQSADAAIKAYEA